MYQITEFFIFRPIFVIELLVGELLFACHLPKKRYFWLRFVGLVLVLIGISCAIPQLYYSSGFNLFYYSSYFFLIFFLSLFGLKWCLNTSFRNCLFAALAGYTVQHFSSVLFQFFSAATGINGKLEFDIYGSGPLNLYIIANNLAPFFLFVFSYVAIFLVLYFLAYLYFSSLVKKLDFSCFNKPLSIGLAALVLFSCIVATGVVTYCFPGLDNRLLISLLDGYNLLCCLLSFVLFVEMPRRQALDGDLKMAEQLRIKEKERYEMSEENINQINIRCHDLKKSLSALTEGRGLDPESVADIEKRIVLYDDSIITKNGAINVVLAEKAMIAEKNGITLSCIIDGEALSFMKDSDVYFLFTNIIDNAIEAVLKLPENKRSIGLNVKRQDDFVMIRSYNWYAGDIVMKEGLPATTKKDKTSHGFGLASITNTSERYGGSVKIKTNDGVFELNIIFPVSAANKSVESVSTPK